MVIEAATENPDIKNKIYEDLEGIMAEDAIIATNTSSLSITTLASPLKKPERFVGMHFFNPVPVMKLVEVIKGPATSQDTLERTMALSQAMGKTPIAANDFPGFVSNRVLMPMINEAFHCLLSGVASAEDIDKAMKLGTHHPMGPLALADLIGLDTCVAILQVLHKGLGKEHYAPCPLMTKYVDAGWLGKKTKRGVYHYKS